MKFRVTVFRIITLLALLTLAPTAALAQDEVACQSDVVVQADDWLSKIADKFYGNPLAFPAIAEATNAKAAADDSYALIENVDLIEPGWRLCVPDATYAETILSESMAEATASASALAAGRPAIPVLRLAGGTDWGYPSPFGYVRGPGYIHSSFIFDTLVWKDAAGNDIPWLAESWRESEDGLTWVFTLRDNARWHDGEPVTVEDVIFSFEYESAHPTGLPVQSLVEVAKVEATGDNEVTITLDKPYAPFQTNLAGFMPIIPKHIWENVADPANYREPDAVTGSGPYQLAEYNQEDGSYLYVANEDFFLGPPAVKRLEFLPVGDELLAVAQDQIDAGSPGVQAGISEDVLAQLSTPPLKMLIGPGEWTMSFKFNMTKEPFNDVRFRQAVAYALDLSDIVERITLGQGEPGNPGWLSPASQWYNPDVPTYEHNLDTANALLDELGLVDSNGDRVREMADGSPLAYELPFAAPFDNPRIAELVQSYLANVGIQITPRALDRNTRDQRASAGEYDLILVGHGGLGGDPDFMRTTFHSQSKSQSFARPHGFVNEEFDRLAGQQLREIDPAARREIVNRMQAIIAEQLPVIPLYHPTRFWFYNPNVLVGWHYTPGGLGSGIPVSLDKNLFVMGK